MHNGALVCLRAKFSFLFTIIIQCQLISYADIEKVMQILSHVCSYMCTKLLVLAFKLGRTQKQMHFICSFIGSSPKYA